MVLLALVCAAATAGLGCSLPRGVVATRDAGAGMDGAVDGGPGPVDAGSDTTVPDDDADLPDTAVPDVGVDGGPPDVGLPDTGPPDAGCTPSCRGMTLTGCGPDTMCSLGCVVDRCRDYVPANVAGRVSFSEGTQPLIVDSFELAVFDTDSGQVDIRTTAAPDTVIRTVRGPGEGVDGGVLFRVVDGLAVFAFSTIEIKSAGRLEGRGARPLVLLADGAVSVGGVVSVSATPSRPGPGGGAGGMPLGQGGGAGGGHEGSAAGAGNDGGGAGGSFGSYGAPGGGITAGLATAPYGNGTCSPLLGGSGGGGSAASSGGGGGGAVQISSHVSITVRGTGGVEASGAGGQGGVAMSTTGSGGGGGGSGGAILLDAPMVRIDGVVAVLGGAGGQGAPCDNGSCSSGMDGAVPRPYMRLEAPSSATSGQGGGGGAGSSAVSGTPAPGGGALNGGGGGGGAGRIRIQTRMGNEMFVNTLPTNGLLVSVGPMAVSPP